MRSSGLFRSVALFVVLIGLGAGLVAWKRSSMQGPAAAGAQAWEPMELVTAALAQEHSHVRTTTSIGTVVALRSITLRNELSGTIAEVALVPGQVVEQGQVLVALDVSVEEAELKAQEAQLALAETLLGRMERASQNRGASEADVDRARAERDVALANIARTKAVIARKTIRAPFRARVGMSDVHQGQYLQEGTTLTTLQGVDEGVHVDFSVAQNVSAGLAQGDVVEVYPSSGSQPVPAKVVAVDARVDPATRNAVVRALIESAERLPAPGASVRVRVAVGQPEAAVKIPVAALRKSPSGDHVFVLLPDDQGKPRAHVRQVDAGAVIGEEVVIHSGLAAGEQIASSGSFKLRENVLVAIQDPNPAAAAAPAPQQPPEQAGESH
jgi:membrane fusion protein, multidrug efflux system